MSAPNLQHLLHLTEHATPGDRIVQHEENPCRGTYIFAGEDERSGYCLQGLISDPDAQLAALAPEALRNIVERLIAAEKLAEAAIKWYAKPHTYSIATYDLIDATVQYRLAAWHYGILSATGDYNHNGGTPDLPDLPDRLLTELMENNP